MVYPKQKQQDEQAPSANILVQKHQNTGFPAGSLLDVMYKGIVRDQLRDQERLVELTEMMGDIQFALRSTIREFKSISSSMKRKLNQATHDNKALRDRIEGMRQLAGPLSDEEDHPAIWGPDDQDAQPGSSGYGTPDAPLTFTATDQLQPKLEKKPLEDPMEEDLDDFFAFLDNEINSERAQSLKTDPDQVRKTELYEDYPTTPEWD